MGHTDKVRVRVIEDSSCDPGRAAGASGSEAGYSLVEVLAAIMLLSLAIIPMVGMLDMGLRAAMAGGDYDRARSLANARLEEVRALPYDSAVELYPPATPVGGTEDAFSYTVRTKYVDADLSNPHGSPPASQMRVEVEVEWQGNSYTTTGYVAGG
jgi:Tfp pilus assembly protein PilV